MAATSGRAKPNSADERERLTPHELRVAALVERGLRNREIATTLSERSVEYHLANMYGKLGLRSRTDLARVFGVEPVSSSQLTRATLAGTIGCIVRRLLLLIIVALPAVATAAAADPPEVRVGRSIGAVRLGMTEAAVTAAYGVPRRTTRWRLAGRSGPIAVYGSLQLFLDAGRVVAVETMSPRYRLAGAIGVGTITPRRPNEFSFSWRGFRYDACNAAYQRRAYGAVTELVLPAGATTGRKIVAVAIADGAHLLLLPGAGRCD